MNIVRQSKFRHVFCKPIKHEQCISEIKITENTWDSLFCDVNPKFIAIINKGSAGPFLVIPLNKTGRIDKDYPFVDAHKAPCLEVQFSPFNDNVIASCSDDTTTKVWLIPKNGLIHTIFEPVVELRGHQKRVNTLRWHPTANNILATAGGDNKVLIWNVENSEALLEVDSHPDQICSISFNYDGSQFVTTCKDHFIRIIDSHSGNVINEGFGHEGIKPQRAIFLKNGLIFSTGFSKSSERLYALRDPKKNLSEPITQEVLDTTNAVLFPFYDEDSGLIYLAGKGDCAIRYYEINDEKPFVHYINTYITSEPQRGLAFMPKRGVNSNENEINRIYKVTTKGVVDILQFFVPRKSNLWQIDLYPDTRSTIPAISAEEFKEGKNSPPNLTPVNPNVLQTKPKIQTDKKTNILAQLQPTALETQRIKNLSESSDLPIITDDDTGIMHFKRQNNQQSIVRHEQLPPSTAAVLNSSIPKHQVTLKSRNERDIGPLTSGQQRAAKELDRIKREQARIVDFDDTTQTQQQQQLNTNFSRQNSITSTVIGSDVSSNDDIISDLQRIKQILRQHERRIRLIEDQLNEINMANTYGF